MVPSPFPVTAKFSALLKYIQGIAYLKLQNLNETTAIALSS